MSTHAFILISSVDSESWPIFLSASTNEKALDDKAAELNMALYETRIAKWNADGRNGRGTPFPPGHPKHDPNDDHYSVLSVPIWPSIDDDQAT